MCFLREGKASEVSELGVVANSSHPLLLNSFIKEIL